ncbi:MAG: malate synthase A, partial [Pseudomonadota bacterium]|nr:malate synthase A [Pseudomonadota bacterium]
MTSKLKIMNPLSEAEKQILNPITVSLIESLHENFENRRQELLENRRIIQKELDDGRFPEFL